VKHTRVSTTPWYLCRNIVRMAYDHIVYIVDDDRSIRESLLGLLDSFGMNAPSSISRRASSSTSSCPT
jgi:hypothetical protein